MNIKQAKEYIENTAKLYLKKDEFGEYRIPLVRQRPLFLLGAPGIGKTAIVEQVAQELGIALVSYSMTHHTRQSALAEKGESGTEQISERLKNLAEGRRKQTESLRNANTLSDRDRKRHGAVIRFLEEGYTAVRTGEASDGKEAYLMLKERFNGKTAELKRYTVRIQQELHALFSFVEEAFGQGNEMLVLVTELTRNNASAQFIAAFGSPDYRRQSGEMMLSQRRDGIWAQIAELDLSDVL